MKKKKVALVFGITSNYTFALANTLIGLLETNKKFWDDIIVYYDEMNENDIVALNKITPINFVKFGNLLDSANISKSLLQKYSIATMYRYKCFDLLKEYECVIWNDVDILITGDISGLVEYGKKSGFAATLSNANFCVEANFNSLIDGYDMLRTTYNAGMLVLRDNLKDYDKMCSWCIDKTIEYANILRWPDQGILNLLIQEFKIEAENIDILKYCCHPNLVDENKDVKIVHAYGDKKFWNDLGYKEKFPEWSEYNDRWLNLVNSNIDESLPLVSCIMSVYKRTQYLEESISSILNQTYTNLEIVFVIEKSDNQEEIEKILKDFKDPRIKIIKNKERLGFAESLNVAIKNSKGKYLARMDDDDISLPTRFAVQVPFMESHTDIGICGTGARFFGESTDIIPTETDPEKLKVITLMRTPFVHPSVMMRKDLIVKYNLYYDSNYFTEDYELWSRAIKYFPIANINQILLLYRAGNEDALTNSINDEKIHNSHLKIMSNQFKEYLGCEMSYDELQLLQGRKWISENFNNFKALDEKLDKTIEKVINLNKEKHFYNQSTLVEVIYQERKGIVKKGSLFKRIIMKIVLPFYSFGMRKVDKRIAFNEKNLMKDLNMRFKELDNRIKKLEQKKNE